ncbi:hypothetical protein [Cytobacillus horneckiae]|uniref:hypothetical protein n=1 Tax=Cytobacillus horneckiae TaxID=549687 RepID=UPI003D9A19F5
MTVSDFRVTGGKKNFTLLTLKLQKDDLKEYEVAKVINWLNMLNKGQKPVRWNKPNKNGTAVRFETIQDQRGYDVALGELEGYITSVNREQGTDLSLNKESK